MPYRHLAVLCAVVAFLAAPGVARAADLQANPSNLASVFASASGGDVIHLAAGSYGSFRGGQKPAMVTIAADAGVTASIGASLTDAAFIRFQNLTVTAATLTRSHHIEFVGNRFTGAALVNTLGRNGDHAIVFDGNTHNGIDVCSTCYEGRLTVHGDRTNTLPVGVTIKNSYFGGGGNSDGIQVGSRGVQILGNEFADLRQGDPSQAHTDAIQLYGASYTTVRGNYMHNVATGIMSGDGTDHEVIEHNVIETNGYPWGILVGPDNGSIVRHNTLAAGPNKGGQLRVCTCNPGTPSRGTVVKDNILHSIFVEGDTTLAEEDYNLVASGSIRGAHDLRGGPTFVGGAAPSAWAGFALAAGSLGKRAASDGTDIGIDINARTAAPAPLPAPGGPAPALPGASSADAAVPPAVRLVRPRPGVSFRSRLRVTAKAGDASGIARVELWVGRRRVRNDTSAPYRWVLRRGSMRRGAHTLSVRAYAADGGVSSTAIRVRRRSASAHAARAGRRSHRSHRWRLKSSSSPAGTRIRGRAAPRRKLAVALASCGDARGKKVRRLRVKSGRRGRVHTRIAAPGLCIVKVVSRR